MIRRASGLIGGEAPSGEETSKKRSQGWDLTELYKLRGTLRDLHARAKGRQIDRGYRPRRAGLKVPGSARCSLPAEKFSVAPAGRGAACPTAPYGVSTSRARCLLSWGWT